MALPGDVRLSLRNLRKNPGFTAAAVAMLALGIGVNATVFTVTDAVLFKGFPGVKDNDRLMYISNGGCCISYPDFEDIRDQSHSFDGMGVTHGIGRVLADQSGVPEHVEVTEVSAGTFALTGARPLLGRDFTAADQAPGSAAVAILNYGFWERRYAKDPDIVGRTIRMNGTPTTVIGVMPAGYTFPQTVDVWTPLVKTGSVMNRGMTQTWFAFGRLRDGVSFESAKAEVEGVIKRLEVEYPLIDQREHLVVQRFPEFFIGSNAAVLYGSMWGAVGFVLLIACANLANLLLARAMERSREISVRIALGAGRWRIVRQLLIESLLLSSLGGFLGWWLARWGVAAYASAMAQKSSWLILDYSMNHRELAYLAAISVATGILFGLAPALRLSRLDVNSSLKDGGRGSTGGAGARRLSSVLVTAEMALAVVLLAGAGVMIRSFLKAHNADMGVNTANVIAGEVELLPGKYTSPDQRSAFYQRLAEAVQSIPGVESVAFTGALPSWGSGRFGYQLADAAAPGSSTNRPIVHALKVSPAYFSTLQARVLAGRDFSAADTLSSPPVALVNQLFAARAWPGQEALGKRVQLFTDQTPGPWLTVAGVVSDIVQNDQNRQRADPEIYLPFGQGPDPIVWVLARTHVRPAGVTASFRRAVQTVDAEVPLYGPFPLAERLERFWDSRFYGALFLIFAAVALLLASIGLYTVVAHTVSRRTQELGVRMAMGATSRDILRLVLRQGMLPVGAGLAIGLASSFGVNRILKAAVVDISPSDPLTLLAASSLLILAAALGCLIPALRAMQVDPVLALRHE